MKTLMILFSLATAITMNAQNHKDEMKKLEPLVGNWKGIALYRMGPGEPQKVDQTEVIELKLEGAVLQIEGLGKVNGTMQHHALAIVNFDVSQKKFLFRSYLSDGKMADAEFSVTGEGKYMWGFEYPGRKIRYVITINDNRWKETGEFSSDGKQWFPFIEMDLVKQ